MTILIFIFSIYFSESLWNNNNNDNDNKSLYTYNNNYKVGDIITVQVLENPNFSISDDVNDYKSASLDTLGSVFNSLGGIDLKKFLPLGSTDPNNINVPNKSEKSSSQAQISLLISSVITEKNNGLLKIRGEKELKVGKKRQKMIIEGYVSEKSVDKTGQVNSSDIANAKIWYDGDVIFQQDPSEPSWTSWLLSGIANVFF